MLFSRNVTAIVFSIKNIFLMNDISAYISTAVDYIEKKKIKNLQFILTLLNKTSIIRVLVGFRIANWP